MRGGTLIIMLVKRLLKRPAFIVLLLLIPLLTFGWKALSKEDSGLITIAVAMEDEDDPLAASCVERLTGRGEAIRFIVCSPDRALKLVEHGRAYAAWIFPEDMAERVASFVVYNDRDDYVARVVQRAESVALRLARERLSSVIYDCCCRELYVDYIRTTFPELDGLTDDELFGYFESVLMNDLFAFTNTEGAVNESPGYLLSPVRGLLAVVIAVGGLASSLFWLRDMDSGTFANVELGRLPLFELLSCLAGTFLTGLAALAALFASGLAGGLLEEAVAMAALVLTVPAFSMAARRIFRGAAAMATAVMVLGVAMAAVCPVFFDLRSVRVPELLFPPSYYLRAFTGGNVWHLYAALYAALIYALIFITETKTPRRD